MATRNKILCLTHGEYPAKYGSCPECYKLGVKSTLEMARGVVGEHNDWGAEPGHESVLKQCPCCKNFVVREVVEAYEDLLKYATEFSFPDGRDCYKFETSGKEVDERGNAYPPGVELWEARGCLRGQSVRWFESLEEALRAIGHWRK